jgi:hypothetical protein
VNICYLSIDCGSRRVAFEGENGIFILKALKGGLGQPHSGGHRPPYSFWGGRRAPFYEARLRVVKFTAEDGGATFLLITDY